VVRVRFVVSLRFPVAFARALQYIALMQNKPIDTASEKMISDEIVRVARSKDPAAVRLHLGCGEKAFPGYVNIDFPPSEHTVQQIRGADVYADVVALAMPDDSVDEVRLHHLFEHFSSATALALLCRWHRWLRPGGRIVIETPDVLACARLLVDPVTTVEGRLSVMRHLFGSQEASWAVHRDGWYDQRFGVVLSGLGFGDLKAEGSGYMSIRNITVSGGKKVSLGCAELREKAHALLRGGMVDTSALEERLWKVWCDEFDKVFGWVC